MKQQVDVGFFMNNPGYDLANAVGDYGTYYDVSSKVNAKAYPVLVFTPQGAADETWPVVYMLHGANDRQLDEAGLRSMYHPGMRMQEAADFFQVILVCPLMGNFYYVDAPKDPGIRHATFIGEELVAWADANLATQAERTARYLAGFSMGGGGSVRLICRYPDTFAAALSHGGALDPKFGVEDLDWDDVRAGDYAIFGNYWGEDRQHYHRASCLNTINHIRDRDDIGLVITIGRDDFLYKINRRLHERLIEYNLKHIYAEYPQGHQWGAQQMFALLTHLQHFYTTN